MADDSLTESNGSGLARTLILAADVAAQRVIACDINQSDQAADWARASESLTSALENLLDARETESRT